MKQIILTLDKDFKLTLETYAKMYELENHSTEILIRTSSIMDGMVYQLHKEQNGVKALVILEKTVNGLSYIVDDGFLAHAGNACLQIRAVGEDVAIESNIIDFRIGRFINATDEPTPEQESVLNKLLVKAEVLAEKADELETLEVNPIENGINVAYDGKSYDIVNGKDGKVGKDGKDGVDGHTPVKGVDYFTPEDKAEIVDEVTPVIDSAVSGKVAPIENRLDEVEVDVVNIDIRVRSIDNDLTVVDDKVGTLEEKLYGVKTDIEQLAIDVNEVKTWSIQAEEDIEAKQDKLTQDKNAGENIIIDANGRISATGGGSGDVTKAYVDAENAKQDAETASIKADLSQLDENKVGFTDFATDVKGGVIKQQRGFALDQLGRAYCTIYKKSVYDGLTENLFISKGTLENRLAPTEDRIDVLEKMSKGILYDFVTQTVEGNQSIPKGSHIADVQKLEGKSIVFNQLMANNNLYPSSNGISFTFNDSKVHYSGTATSTYAFIIRERINIPIGHKVLCKGVGSDVRLDFRDYVSASSTYRHNYVTDGSIIIVIENGAVELRFVELVSGTEYYGDLTIGIFDLTQMFGSGNEPTIEQFNAMFPNDYYPYNIGELQSVDLTKMTVRGKNLCDLSKFEYVQKWIGNVNAYMYKLKVKPNVKYTLSSNVPYASTTNLYFDGTSTEYAGVWLDTPKSTRADADGNLYIAIADGRTYTSDLVNGNYWIQLEEGEVATDYSPYSETDYPITFVGKSAGIVRDELDLVNKKYIQRVGVVDLGSLNWTYNTTSWANKIFYANVVGRAYGNNGLNRVYTKANYSHSDSRFEDKSIEYASNNSYLYVKDDSITDANTFKSALQGVMLYYELTEPIITDVSTVIDSFEAEGNGSIEFDSSIPVKNTIEYLRYLNEV